MGTEPHTGCPPCARGSEKERDGEGWGRSQIPSHRQLTPLHLMPKTEDADGFLLLFLPTSKTHLEPIHAAQKHVLSELIVE